MSNIIYLSEALTRADNRMILMENEIAKLKVEIESMRKHYRTLYGE